ncbi:TetR/AcrR family transcriptional regulator [Gordonia sp. i37]|uniref:TetR/AcrR family transcriptional regulator n=1 Tax=Gordonia sp. i37 TaxID=1961707 RepID=UPI0009ADF5D6|nr:TetR/AcrR family transcriptional regulator [Gordonia sp. i37]OPX10308.1 TetR family transcriptional regulator [Gordonia sp. i37]
MRSTDGDTFTERARRRQLVGCAIDAIAELGFAQASVRKIAERGGVAMSVVLYHFGNKDELVAAVVSECYRTLLEAMVPAVGAEASATGKLAAHIRTHLRYMQTHRAHQIAIMEISQGFRGRDGARLAGVAIDAEHRDGLAAVDLEVIFRLGVDTGEFRSVSVDSMATAVRGAIGSALLRVTAQPDFDLTGYGTDLIEAFIRACAPDPG